MQCFCGCINYPYVIVIPFSVHRTRLFIDWLYLSARNQDLPYATPVNTAGMPIGTTAAVSSDYSPGFRLGGAIATTDDCTSLYLAWTRFRSSESDAARSSGGTLLRSNLAHPAGLPVAPDSNLASAAYDVDFETADVLIDHTFRSTCYSRLNGHIGLRWAALTQDVRALHVAGGGVRSIGTEIDFDGIGPRAGFDYERIGRQGLITYYRGALSLLAGEFDARYRQVGPGISAAMQDDRLVPQIDLELGLGWESHDGAMRMTAGYFWGLWHNTLAAPDFINGVQSGQLPGVDETLIFDGLAIRAEVRY